eukprot:scaffold141165_cov30-Tisochrysis_lutea.AAC.2
MPFHESGSCYAQMVSTRSGKSRSLAGVTTMLTRTTAVSRRAPPPFHESLCGGQFEWRPGRSFDGALPTPTPHLEASQHTFH